MDPDEASPVEWAYPSGFQEQDRQPPPADGAVRRALRRRLLVEETDNGWRLRIPLMQRWLRRCG